jgi:uncharacterized membrane protein
LPQVRGANGPVREDDSWNARRSEKGVPMTGSTAASRGNEDRPGEASAGTAVPQVQRTAYKYQLRSHVFLVHFPISAFLGSFAFMVLHLVTETNCFELSAYVALVAGAVVMIPTTVSGWTTWKTRYRGVRGRVFLRKIRISFAMIGISIFLSMYHGAFVVANLDILHNVWHFLYFLGITLLLVGAIAEGYYGGRLNHR